MSAVKEYDMIMIEKRASAVGSASFHRARVKVYVNIPFDLSWIVVELEPNLFEALHE